MPCSCHAARGLKLSKLSHIQHAVPDFSQPGSSSLNLGSDELCIIGSYVTLLEGVWSGCGLVFAGQSRWRCNLVSQCVGASDLWPPCLSVELPFDCFIPSRALESMLMSKVLIYQSIRGQIQLSLLKKKAKGCSEVQFQQVCWTP